jgi:hypothetical protein
MGLSGHGSSCLLSYLLRRQRLGELRFEANAGKSQQDSISTNQKLGMVVHTVMQLCGKYKQDHNPGQLGHEHENLSEK